MAQVNGEGQAPEPEKRRGGLTGRAVLHAVRRRPFALLGVTLLAVGVGAAVWFFLPLPKATAAVVFQISSQAPSILPTAQSQGDFSSYKQAQMALVKRRLTLNGVLKQPAVQNLEVIRQQPDQMAWLDNSLKVDSKLNSEFMRVSLEGNKAEDLQAILEVLSKAYLADAEERDNGARRSRLTQLEKSNRDYRAEVERFQKRIDTIAMALGSKDGPTLALMDSLRKDDLRTAIHDLAALRDQLQWAELDLAKAGGSPSPAPAEEFELDPTVPRLVSPVPPSPPSVVISPALVDEELRRDPGLKELETAVAQARQALADTKKLFRDGERPDAVLNAETKLRDAEQRRDKYRDDLRPRIEAALREQHNLKEEERLRSLRSAVELLKKKEALAKAKIGSIEKEIAKSNDYRIELENLKSQIGHTETLSNRLTEAIDHLKLDIGAASRVTMVEEPYIVVGLEGNRRLKYTLLAAIGVLVAGFAAVVLWEHRFRRVTHTDDVTTALGVRLIGAVPAASPTQGAESTPHPVLVEAVDATRTMLLGSSSDSDLRVLVVTSAVSGEGKTSLSGHLAISLARAGFRTLLIDGDLRAPTAQRVFDLPLSPGLCEVLQGRAGSAVASRPTGVPGLSVMTAGEWTLATRQALAGDGWRAVKEQLKAEFDYVVVDTSPLLLVSDTLLLAREADGVVVSVLMGVSQVALVDEAMNRLRTVQAKVTGVIANGVRSAAHEYTHGYRPNVPAVPAVALETPASER